MSYCAHHRWAVDTFYFVLLVLLVFPRSILGQNVTLDDTDPSLTFLNCNTGNATSCVGLDCPDPTKLLNGTWHDCGEAPALNFTFTGRGFWIFGVVPESIGGVPFPISITTNGQQTSGNIISNLPPHTSNISLGSVTGLKYGKHSVSVSGPVGRNPGYMLVDYVVLDTTPPPQATTRSRQPPSHTGQSTKSPTSSANNVGTAQLNLKVGAIVGAVVGAILLILAVLVLVLLWRRRRRRQHVRPAPLDLLDDSETGINIPASTNLVAGASANRIQYAQSSTEPVTFSQGSSQSGIPPFPILYSNRMAPTSPLPLMRSDPRASLPSYSTAMMLHPIGDEVPFDPFRDPSCSSSYQAPIPPSHDASSSSAPASNDDTLRTWADEHRSVITQSMEECLRKVGYQPGQDPDDISVATWASVGVGPHAVEVLRNIYRGSRSAGRLSGYL